MPHQIPADNVSPLLKLLFLTIRTKKLKPTNLAYISASSFYNNKIK